MTDITEQAKHQQLDCGVEAAVMPLAGRSVVAMEIRLLAGYAFEKPDRLGTAHLLGETITKGTEQRDGRELNDAFDEIGASHSCGAGRETVTFFCLCLPEFLEQAIALHAEMIRTPSLPQDACDVAIELARQELAALDDDPGELAKKLLCKQAYGDPLGRHLLGEKATLARIGRADIVQHWKQCFSAGRMSVAVAGAVEPERVFDALQKNFDGFTNGGSDERQRPMFDLQFSPERQHFNKELEQEQIAICYPGAAITDEDYAVQRVTIGVLSGGMSGRLFTEVREKQGLVYWVGAWGDYPRSAGLVHLGASTTPVHVEKTYHTLLKEIDRLADDLTDEEINRAITGIVTRARTRGDVSRSKAMELGNDLFYHGRPIPMEEKLDRVKAVDINAIRNYLKNHPRDQLSIVTLGPRELSL